MKKWGTIKLARNQPLGAKALVSSQKYSAQGDLDTDICRAILSPLRLSAFAR
jgi:hypothetical protein